MKINNLLDADCADDAVLSKKKNSVIRVICV